MSIKQIYIDNANASSAAAKALKSDDFISKAKQNNAANKQAAVDTYSAGMDSQINNTQAYYDKQIGDTKVAYESQYQKNAVQKLINEKQIAERNANLGLTDSGLNRTQQTAAQLSYANQKGKIDLARQSALDEFALKLTNAITTLQYEKASGIRGIEEKWDNLSTEQGINEYNTQLNYYNDLTKAYTDAATKIEEKEIDAAAAVEKERINAAAIEAGKANNNFVRFTYSGLDDDGNSIFYRDGKKYTYERGINPYTGTKNKDVKYGTFGNGYQPNNVGTYEDENGNTVVNKLTASGKRDYVNGIEQSVWTDLKEQEWIWDGTLNRYRKYEDKD